jgi:DNA-binding MarR family transcriptional regulator
MKHHRTLHLISSIRERANSLVIRELEEANVRGIVPSHGAILMALYEKKSMTMKEIADTIRRTQPTVTVLVEKLLNGGYVEKMKSAGDGRTTRIMLTKKGEEFRPVFSNVSTKLNKRMHKGLSDSETRLLTELLERVLGNV